jgi:hypothetical protein
MTTPAVRARTIAGMADSYDTRSVEQPSREATIWTLVIGGSLAFWPRLILLGFWIFSRQIGHAFSSWVVPAVGLVVAPSTTLAYAIMWSIGSDKVSGLEWIVVFFGVVLDVVTWSLLARLRR